MDRFRLAVFNTQPPHLYFGGVERRIMETAKRLQGEAEITVYSGTKAGFKEPVSVDGVRIMPLHSSDTLYPLDNWSFNRSLAKAAGKIEAEADVFEAHAVSAYAFPSALKKLGVKKPFVHTVHGVLADEYEQAKQAGHQSPRGSLANRFMHRQAQLEMQTAQQASLIVTISNYSLAKIKQHYAVDASKVRIVPNGVDVERFKPVQDSAALRRQFGLGEEPCVLFVGSLIPRKGLLYIVEAAKIVVKQQPNAKFLIVGDGPMKNLLANTVSEANISGNFVFMGNLKENELPAIYGCSDVFVLPSIQEGQGIVLLEAQASGVPVVTFNVGGVAEAVRDGETGFLVERGDCAALADGLLKLLGDGQLRLRMGEAGRRFVSENFTWDICAERMLKVYREALSLNAH